MIIIIGGGISGLYCAYRLEQLYPNIKIIIIEKESTLGGRLRMTTFDDKKVVCGAGIGRIHKDVLLQKLLIELGMPIEKKTSHLFVYDHYKNEFHKQKRKMIEKYVKILKKEMYIHRNHLDFKNYFLNHFSMKNYEDFKWNVGYSDYEQSDIVDTLLHYGFDDTFDKNEYFPINWDHLIKNIRKKLKNTMIIRNTNVIAINRHTKSIITNDHSHYHYDKLIIAGTRNTLELIDQSSFEIKKNQIGFQPFLRMYIKTEKPLIFDKMVYINHFLQKIIPISKNVYMVSYSDNENALLSNMIKKQDLKTFFNGTKIIKMKKCFHTIGTHFYYPLNERWNSRPEFIKDVQTGLKDIFIIGEMISLHQGWTEGALQSVESILHSI
jgi:hypothetical protein